MMKLFAQLFESKKMDYPLVADWDYIFHYINNLHEGDYEDVDRIGERYELKSVNTDSLDIEWELDEEKVAEFVKRYQQTNFIPPIVIDRFGSLLDGTHRLAAAKELGLSAISAYVESDLVK